MTSVVGFVHTSVVVVVVLLLSSLLSSKRISSLLGPNRSHVVVFDRYNSCKESNMGEIQCEAKSMSMMWFFVV